MVPGSNMSSMLNFPKLNGNNYYALLDNIMLALQARLLWLIVDGQQPSPLKPPSSPLVDATTKLPVPITSVEHQAWVHLQNKHIQWLESNLAAIGLMCRAIEFGQWQHIQTATTSKEMWNKLHQLHVMQQQDTNVHYYL